MSALSTVVDVVFEVGEAASEQGGLENVSTALAAAGFTTSAAESFAEENPIAAGAALLAGVAVTTVIAPELVGATAAFIETTELMTSVGEGIAAAAEAGGLDAADATALGDNAITIASQVIANTALDKTTEAAVESLISGENTVAQSLGGSAESIDVAEGSPYAIDSAQVASGEAMMILPSAGGSTTDGSLLILGSSGESDSGELVIGEGTGGAITLASGDWSSASVQESSSTAFTADVADTDGGSEVVTVNNDGTIEDTLYSGPNGTGTVTGDIENFDDGSSEIHYPAPAGDDQFYLYYSGPDGTGDGTGTLTDYPDGTSVFDSFPPGEPSVSTYYSGPNETGEILAVFVLNLDGSSADTYYEAGQPSYTVYYNSEGEYVDTVYYNTACFAAGTRILTADGRMVAVEEMQVGEKLETYGGQAAAIIWIGHRTIALARHPCPETVQPILIAAGALGIGIPCRDLVVSPDHAMYLHGHLIPAKALLNGFSIRQLNRARITYYHIEFAQHAILFAEAAAAESYLDTGNRAAFEDGGPALNLHPDFAQRLREAKGCAPFAESGPAVEAARQHILNRADIETTSDPALTIRYRKDTAIIESRSAIPGEIFADPRDRRRLGVKIASLRADGHDIPLDHPALSAGWHHPEPDGRWTNGSAEIPGSLLRGCRNLQFTLAATLRYPLQAVDGVRRARQPIAKVGGSYHATSRKPCLNPPPASCSPPPHAPP
jgi:hypothetical protein